MHQSHLTRIRALICLSFFLLGAQTGVRAVGVSDIYLRLHLTPGQLGVVSAVGVVAGVLTLLVGGRLIDRLGRRPILIIGLAGTGLSYVMNAHVDSYSGLLGVWALYGLFCSFIDLGANTVAADHERATGVSAMTSFHSWFSAGAAAASLGTALALNAGQSFRPAFTTMGVVLAMASMLFWRSALPTHSAAISSSGTSERVGSVARVPMVLLATAIVFFCFFGDGVLETFLSTFVRTGSSALIAGLSLACFHAASWIGRVISHRIIRSQGERRVLVAAGLIAAVAISGSIAVRESWAVVLVLAVVGFAIAPIVPIGFSLAGRAAPYATGRAIGFATAVGYTAFIVSPLVAGILAEHTSLGWGIGLAAITVLLVAVLGTRVPHGRPCQALGTSITRCR